MAAVREGPAAENDVEQVGGEADAQLDQIDELIALAAAVLRALARTGPAELEISAGVHAAVDLERARQAAPTLHALLSNLRDAVGGTQLVPVANGGTSRAAAALRDLLATLLVVPAASADDTPTEPAEEVFQHAVAEGHDAADALEYAAGWSEDETTPDESGDTWVVTNLTPRRVELRRRDGVAWVLPAHGRRSTNRDPRVELDLAQAEGRGDIFVCKEPDPAPVDYSPLALWVFAIPIGAAVGASQGAWAAVLGGVIGFVLPLAWFLVGAGRSRASWRGFMRDLPGQAVQAVTFLVVLTFCLAVPAVTLYYGADLKPIVSDIWEGDGDRVDYLTVVCRTMQLVLIAVASMLPALLYYQFDRDRLSTLRERFEHQIFRLDRNMRTSGDIEAKYGKQIDEIYGPARRGRSGKLPPGRRAPIFVATVLIMLGWLLVLLNPDVGRIADEATIAELFHPRQTAPAFAFLGAYFFSLFALLRGYVRRDLRPKSYSDISVRIVTVVILAWVLELMVDDDSSGLLVFAFVVGIVPQALLNRLRELSETGMAWLKGPHGKDGPDAAVAAALADPLPLTDLQGIDLYDRTRLASEGVTNIEALAHHDLVELMLLTRIPVPRLVDWTDQAILHLHVTDSEDRAALRRYGIRTASDLVHAYNQAMATTAQSRKDEFLAILGGDDGKPKRLAVIVEAMKDEAWMDSIRYWHGDADPTSANGSVSGRP